MVNVCVSVFYYYKSIQYYRNNLGCILHPIQLGIIIQVSDNIMNSLKFNSGLNKVFCLVIVTIYLKI